MALIKLTEMEQLKQLLQQEGQILLLKNSTTCPVSHEAFRQFQSLVEEQNDEKIYYLNVQEARPMSNEIAEMFSVKHESPQVLLFKNGTVTWHTSHWNITYKTLKEHI